MANMTTLQILQGIKTWVTTKLNLKQDVINDLANIRSGAQAGSTAVQPAELSAYFNNASYDNNAHRINFYHGQTVVAYVDASPFIIDGMVDDVRIENGYLVIDFNTASGKQDISIPLSDIFDPSNYYNKTQTDTLLDAKANKSEMSITDGTGDDADKTTIQLKTGLSKRLLKSHIPQDNAPTENSSNNVKSGGVFSYIATAVANAVTSVKEWVEEGFARINGSYAGLNAGSADRLTGDVLYEGSFVKETAGGNIDFGDGSVRVKELEGQGEAISQLYDPKAGGSSVATETQQLAYLFGKRINRYIYDDYYNRIGFYAVKEQFNGFDLSNFILGWNQKQAKPTKINDFFTNDTSASIDDGVITILNRNRYGNINTYPLRLYIPSGHKIYMSLFLKATTANTPIRINNITTKYVGTSWKRFGMILNVSSSPFYFQISDFRTSNWDNYYMKDELMVFDLTNMGIASQISTEEDFEQWCDDHNIDLSTYQSYNPGYDATNEVWTPSLTDDNKSSYTGCRIATRLSSIELVNRNGSEGSYTYTSWFISGNAGESAKRQVWDMSNSFGIANSYYLPSPYNNAQPKDWVTYLEKTVGLMPFMECKNDVYGVTVFRMYATKNANIYNPTTASGNVAYYNNADDMTMCGAYAVKVRNGAVISAVTFTPALTGLAETVLTEAGIFQVLPEHGYGTVRVTLSSGNQSDVMVYPLWNNAMADKWREYDESSTDEIEVIRIYGKINGDGEYVKIESDGVIKGAKTARSILNFKEGIYTKKVNSVILGNLTWIRNGYKFSCVAPTDIIKYGYSSATNSYIPNVISAKYPVSSSGVVWDKSMMYVLGMRQIDNKMNFGINDNRYSTLAAFTDALSGVYVYYEMNEAIIYSDLMYDISPLGDGSQLVPLSNLTTTFIASNFGMWGQEPSAEEAFVAGTPSGVAAYIEAILPVDVISDVATLNSRCDNTDDFLGNIRTTLPTALASAGVSGITISDDGTVEYNG